MRKPAKQYRTDAEKTGDLIKRLRKAAGMTQMQIAEKMGITYQQVQKYEKGASELTIKRLKQVASALSVPPDTFIPEARGVSEPESFYLSDEETDLLALYRKIGRRKLREGVMGMLKDLAELSEKLPKAKG